MDLCTWCSITWNVLDPIPAWVTPRTPLRLSESITPSKKTSPSPLSWMWWTCIHFHSHLQGMWSLFSYTPPTLDTMGYFHLCHPAWAMINHYFAHCCFEREKRDCRHGRGQCSKILMLLLMFSCFPWTFWNQVPRNVSFLVELAQLAVEKVGGVTAFLLFYPEQEKTTEMCIWPAWFGL